MPTFTLILFPSQMARSSAVLGLLLYILVSLPSAAHPVIDGPGQWSTEAIDLRTPETVTVPEFGRDMLVRSPDNKMAIHVVKNRWWVEQGGRRLSLTLGEAKVSYPAELAWSPDSKAFYITQSEGSIAGYQTEIYQIDGTRLRRLPDINQTLRQEFNRKFECVFYDNGKRYVEESNIAGLKWIDNSTQLLIVVEVLPDSWCKHREYFGGYLLNVREGTILDSFSPNRLLQRFPKQLGQRLRGDYEDLTAREREIKP